MSDETEAALLAWLSEVEEMEGARTFHGPYLTATDNLLRIARAVRARKTDEWRDVPGYEGIYMVSESGEVRRGIRVLRPAVDRKGYAIVSLSREGMSKTCKVHRLVALAWLGEGEGQTVNHIDGNKLNNHRKNLEYLTRDENIRHAARTGLNAHGERHPQARLTAAQATAIARARRDGVPTKQLASQYGVSSSHINSIAAGIRWRSCSSAER